MVAKLLFTSEQHLFPGGDAGRAVPFARRLCDSGCTVLNLPPAPLISNPLCMSSFNAEHRICCVLAALGLRLFISISTHRVASGRNLVIWRPPHLSQLLYYSLFHILRPQFCSLSFYGRGHTFALRFFGDAAELLNLWMAELC